MRDEKDTYLVMGGAEKNASWNDMLGAEAPRMGVNTSDEVYRRGEGGGGIMEQVGMR
jgi:hypothetical protein